MWRAGSIKLAVTGHIIVGCIAENAEFGRTCATRSAGIADGGPANAVLLWSEEIGGETNRHELSIAGVGGILCGPAMIRR